MLCLNHYTSTWRAPPIAKSSHSRLHAGQNPETTILVPLLANTWDKLQKLERNARAYKPTKLLKRIVEAETRLLVEPVRNTLVRMRIELLLNTQYGI